jgi:hypothetical protein
MTDDEDRAGLERIIAVRERLEAARPACWRTELEVIRRDLAAHRSDAQR